MKFQILNPNGVLININIFITRYIKIIKSLAFEKIT